MCCDGPGQVEQFIAEPDRFINHPTLPISNPWSSGDSLTDHHADGWKGRPLRGGSRNARIKFVAR